MSASAIAAAAAPPGPAAAPPPPPDDEQGGAGGAALAEERPELVEMIEAPDDLDDVTCGGTSFQCDERFVFSVKATLP